MKKGHTRILEEILPSLQKLQDDRKWSIIIVSNTLELEKMEWLPPHHYFHHGSSYEGPLFDLTIKNLMDVIQNPNYDRYDMTYRWVMASENLLSRSCLRQVNKIHILIDFWWDVYLPMTMAVLRKENDHRKQERQTPLEIVFYYQYGYFWYYRDDILKRQPGGEYVGIKYRQDHPLLHKNESYKMNDDKENVYINLLDEKLFKRYCEDNELLLQSQNYRYRLFRSKSSRLKNACYNDENIKIFASPEELFENISNDMCGRNK